MSQAIRTGQGRRTGGAPLPPGPRLPATVQTALLLRDPVRYFQRCQRRYGSVFRTGFVGAPGLVYVAEPELARQVFATDRDIGHAGAARREFLEPIVGSNSLLCLDGDEWVRQRKFLGSALHGRRIARYRDEIAAIAADHVRRWPVGEPFGLRPRMQAITLEVILRVVFGVRDDARVEDLRRVLPTLMTAGEAVDALTFVLPRPLSSWIERVAARMPGSPFAQVVAARTAADELLYDEIAGRRAEPGVDDRADILSVLLGARDENGAGLSDVEIRDGLMTLLLAGHETTATALAWAFERLVRNPAVLDRLVGALADGDEDYLDAVVKETLRTRPVVADMPRTLTEPMHLNGYRIPAGWWVSPAAVLLHDAAGEYPEPHEFRPERFVGDDTPLHAWIPFGGGRRQCLGSQFALLEMKTITPQVLARLRPRTADDRGPERPRTRNVTLAPARDGRIVAELA